MRVREFKKVVDEMRLAAGKGRRPLLTSLVAAGVAVAALGCGKAPGQDVPMQTRSEQLDNEARTALAAAKAESDPWKAHEMLARTYDALSAAPFCEFTLIGGRRCTEDAPKATKEEVLASLVRYEAAAIRLGNPVAIVATYDNGRGKRLGNYVTAMLAAAERAQGTPEDRELLRVAGSIFAGGRWVVLDTRRAIGYLARAWAAGVPQAANDAAVHFEAINDLRNAYLWSLRCTDPCTRSDLVALDRLQAALQPAAIEQIQSVAADAFEVELDVTTEERS